MTRLIGASADRLAEHFINYLFDQYRGSRHVRRVASWIGFIIRGIERMGVDEPWWIPRSRQVRFDYKDASFKVKYDHTAGARGGISIVEILPGRGSPEGRVVVLITNLAEAENFYNQSTSILERFIGSRSN